MATDSQTHALPFNRLPILAVRQHTILPGQENDVLVGREHSLKAVQQAEDFDNYLLLLTQIDADEQDINFGSLYPYGTLAHIDTIIEMPEGQQKLTLSSMRRVKITGFVAGGTNAHQGDLIDAEWQPLSDAEDHAAQASVRKDILQIRNDALTPILTALAESSFGTEELVMRVASTSLLRDHEQVEMLQLENLLSAIQYLLGKIGIRKEAGNLEKQLREQVKVEADKHQREYLLHELIKSARDELRKIKPSAVAEGDDDELLNSIRQANLPEHALDRAMREWERLNRMSPQSSEHSILRSYIECLTEVPWSKQSELSTDITKTKRILENDHYGLNDINDYILEYLAVHRRVGKIQGPILCFVGPPGVGKTSLGESIAKATGREYIRLALGGVRDEAEIRGHRRTYVGAMPGRIIQKMMRAGTKNPLFLLDEVDKMGRDFHGDPSSALLEVLDPEQNPTFSDHYLELDYDLSEVMFICTANSMNIQPALADRMEIIRIPGYTEREKKQIARKFLIPKNLTKAGLAKNELRIQESALTKLVREYSNEAGVRTLERQIAKIARKVVLEKDVQDNAKDTSKQATKKQDTLNTDAKKTTTVVGKEHLNKYLGAPVYLDDPVYKKPRVGRVMGLAWTSVGGATLPIEAVCIPEGSGKLVHTGSLGKVLQESGQIAMTLTKARVVNLPVFKGFPKATDIHVHLPSGATPKDGPSAGVGLVIACVSAVCGVPVDPQFAVTGEISIHGDILRIGGLKEKLLAAKRSGMKTIAIPNDNQAELSEIPEDILKGLDIHTIARLDQVWELCFRSAPKKYSETIDKLKQNWLPSMIGAYSRDSLVAKNSTR